MKKEYKGSLRHFTLHEADGKIVSIGNVSIKEHQTPLDAAKKLFSCYCRNKGVKSNERNKVNIKFCIRETTRSHGKIYGPYKGKFVKYNKPLMVKLKTGKTIKIVGKPYVKLSKNNMVGGDNNEKNNKIIIENIDNLERLINILKVKYISEDLSDKSKKLLKKIYKIENLEKLYEKKKILRIDNNQTYLSNRIRHLFNSKKNEQTIGFKYELHFKIKLSDLDVSKITDMSKLFENFDFQEHNCEDVDISNWDVYNVTNMSYMFYNSKGFNQNLSGWNVSNVNYMKSMFCKCEDFNQDLNNWNGKLNNITSMEAMFAKCNSFNNNNNKLIWKIDNKNLITLKNIFYNCFKIIKIINKKESIGYSEIYSELNQGLDTEKINIIYNLNNEEIKLMSPYGTYNDVKIIEKIGKITI